MTLRDWFAGQALSGLAASVSMDRKTFELISDGTIGAKFFAYASYVMADAMIEARKVKNEK